MQDAMAEPAALSVVDYAIANPPYSRQQYLFKKP